jgi:RNA polymerase sigma-70 factor (ECF subfamily)
MIVDKANMVSDVQGVEVARLRAKDAQAFHALIERLQQPITGYLHRLVGDREVALDLAQDTFLQVYKEIGKTSMDLSLDAWIYRIATNYGLQYLNRKRLRQFISFSRNFHPSAEEAMMTDCGERGLFVSSTMSSSVEDQTEMRILIQQTLEQLKPKDAACLQLHYGNGFTYEEISRIVNMTPEAVRKRVARGVSKFRIIYSNAVATSATQIIPAVGHSLQEHKRRRT